MDGPKRGGLNQREILRYTFSLSVWLSDKHFFFLSSRDNLLFWFQKTKSIPFIILQLCGRSSRMIPSDMKMNERHFTTGDKVSFFFFVSTVMNDSFRSRQLFWSGADSQKHSRIDARTQSVPLLGPATGSTNPTWQLSASQCIRSL